jgi:serine phosphatase RsbU (regulator of sigma subunit)
MAGDMARQAASSAQVSRSLVPMLVESLRTSDGQPVLPRRREPDFAGLAAFTLDPGGRVVSWSVTATALFGPDARAAIGRDVCDVLMTGPGQRELVGHALAEVAAGRVWTATVAGGSLGEGRFAFRWEAMAGPGGAVLVVVQRAWPQRAPSWLSEATARIGSSLDLAETAAEVADAAVPWFADAAGIYVIERLLAADELASPRAGFSAAVRRLAARLSGPVEAATGAALPVGEVIVLSADSLRSQAMATGKPVLASGGPKIVVGCTSFLAMPLIARGVVVGCAVFGRAAASPAFNAGDVALAGALAARAAVGIDNARLYDRERRTALALQRGLLPGQPDIPAGMEVAHAYLPVGDHVVGGDWHDIVRLPDGRAALIVGDAMGHGPEAAAVMVQLRTAAHTLAELGLPPGQVLCKLDAMAAAMDGALDGAATDRTGRDTAGRDGAGNTARTDMARTDMARTDMARTDMARTDTMAAGTAAPFATCVYAVIDPSGGASGIVQAGHLPPVLVLPDGATEVLDLPPGLPLGLGAGSFQVTQFSLIPGATLALYTDGLVESRTRPIDDGLAALRGALSSALAEPGSTLDGACQTVTQLLCQQGEDDITLMLARTRQ